MSRSFRLLTEYREPSPSMEVSSTATEYRVPSIEYRHRVSSTVTEYQVPSPSIEVPSPSMEVSSTITVSSTEYRVPSTITVENRHRVWKYRVSSTEHREERYRGSSTVTECRVPSTECSPSIENQRTSHPSYAARSNPIPTLKLVKMYEVRVLILQGGIKKGREMTPVDRMDIGKDMGLDRGACNGCNGRRGSS